MFSSYLQTTDLPLGGMPLLFTAGDLLSNFQCVPLGNKWHSVSCVWFDFTLTWFLLLLILSFCSLSQLKITLNLLILLLLIMDLILQSYKAKTLLKYQQILIPNSGYTINIKHFSSCCWHWTTRNNWWHHTAY